MPTSTARTLATPRRKPSRNRLMRYERAGWTPVGLARSGRVSLGPVRFEAFGAVDRPIAPRLEGHLTRLAAAAAHDVVHGLRPYGGALGLGATAAIQTALWLVQQALLRVELLLTGGPHECVGALPAGQRLVHEFSRHPRSPAGNPMPGGQAPPRRPPSRGVPSRDPCAGARVCRGRPSPDRPRPYAPRPRAPGRV